MALTLLEIRTQARNRADMLESEFVSDSELTFSINQSIKELHDILTDAYQSDYYMKYLLTVGLLESTNMKRIDAVCLEDERMGGNRRPGPVESRYRELFADRRFEFHPKEVEAVFRSLGVTRSERRIGGEIREAIFSFLDLSRITDRNWL